MGLTCVALFSSLTDGLSHSICEICEICAPNFLCARCCGKWSSEGCPHGVAQSTCHLIIVAILMLKPEKSRRSLTTVLSMKIQMSIGKTVLTLYIKKVCADLPYSQTGLPQPNNSYDEVCTQRCILQRVVFLLLKIPVRGGSSSGN